MTVFVDASALYACYDADDDDHAQAAALWSQLVAADAHLLTTNYVLIEAAALLQRRLGLAWVERLHLEARPLLDVIWVGDDLHDLAIAAAVAAGRRRVSIVDHLSLEIMRRRSIRYALAFDAHFDEAGYTLPPLGDATSPVEQEIP